MTEKYKVLKEIMDTRRAIRSYIDGKKVSLDDLELIFDATNTTPSSLGLEDWRVVNIRNAEIKEEVSKYFFGNNKISSHRCSDIAFFITSLDSNFVYENERLRKIIERNHKTITKGSDDYEEKVKIAIGNISNNVGKKNQCNPTSGNISNLEEWSSRQAYIAILSLMLAATSLDINTTPTEGFSFEINEFFRQKGFITKDEKVSVAVFIGYVNPEKDKNWGKKHIRLETSEKFKVI